MIYLTPTITVFCGHVVVAVYLHRLCRRTSTRSVELNKRLSFPQPVSCCPPPSMYTVVYTQLLSFLAVSELLHSTARVNPYKFGQREKFGQNILNAFYVTLNLAPGLQRLQRFDSHKRFA